LRVAADRNRIGAVGGVRASAEAEDPHPATSRVSTVLADDERVTLLCSAFLGVIRKFELLESSDCSISGTSSFVSRRERRVILEARRRQNAAIVGAADREPRQRSLNAVH
jgi:hypothetical protein